MNQYIKSKKRYFIFFIPHACLFGGSHIIDTYRFDISILGTTVVDITILICSAACFVHCGDWLPARLKLMLLDIYI